MMVRSVDLFSRLISSGVLTMRTMSIIVDMSTILLPSSNASSCVLYPAGRLSPSVPMVMLPTLRSVMELNPDAKEIARQMDEERKAGQVRGPLHGIPILIKDNIDTGDSMMTTAGSLALTGFHAPKDAFIVSKLRAAGATIQDPFENADIEFQQMPVWRGANLVFVNNDFGEGSAAARGFPDMPSWFNGNKDFPNIAKGLRTAGFSEPDVADLMGGNWVRFFRDNFGARETALQKVAE